MSPPQGRKAVGHPVDVASGAFFCAWHDIEIPGYAPLVFRRYFSTGLTNEQPGALGPGWTHNFAISLTQTADGFRLQDQNGGVVAFPMSQGQPIASTLNESASMELRPEGDAICVYHWHDWHTAVEKLWFRRLPTGHLLLERIAPPSGFGLVLTYDSGGLLSSVRQMIEGRRISFRRNTRGLVSEILVESPASSPRSFATYLYDSGDRLVEVRDAGGNSMRYAYDSAGRIVTEETRSGAVFQMRYDGTGRCVSTRGADGYHECHLRYALDGRLTLVRNSLGHVTAYELNGSGQVLTERRPNGAMVSTRYDGFGRIVEELDPLGRATLHSYDESGNTATVTYASGLSTEARYNQDHQPVLFRHGESTWQFGYTRGQLTSVLDPRGVETRYEHSARGFLSSIREPSGNTVTIEPDEGWARVRFADAYGLEHEEHYDDLMYITRRTEPDGGTYGFESDALGRLVRAVSPGSSPREYTYDAGGYLASATDADGHTTHLHHNQHGFIEEIVTPMGRTYVCTWDTEGRLSTWVNPAGERAEFEYDTSGNEIIIRHFDGRVEGSDFDLAGRPVRRRLGDGTEVAFEYDVSDNLVRIHSEGVDLMLSEYDVAGRPLRTRTPGTEVSFEYDLGFRIVAEVQNGRRVEYAYDSVGALLSRRFSGSPLPALEFTWDSRMRLVALSRGGLPVQACSYNAKDQCVERRFGECIERLEYNSFGSLVSQGVARGDRPLVSRAWTYDGRGNVVTAYDGAQEHRYEIDGDHRLVRSWTNRVATEYRYDAGGNLIRWERGAQGRTFEYLAGNRLVRSGERLYERDINGRVTRIVEGDLATSLLWNPLGQLTEVVRSDGSAAKYVYDGLGRRARSERRGASTEFVWAGEQLLAEVSGDQVTEYLFDEFNPTTSWRGSVMFTLVNSHLGVPLEAVAEQGSVAWYQRLDDWGNLERAEGTREFHLPLRFPGQYADEESGLYYNRFRYYDPYACQYLSPDPQGLAAGANEYIYCPNPLNWIDPFGLACGIPPGQHSVYVLEKGKRATPGPPPTPAVPPTPPIVIYVGITVQSPHDRFSQHKGAPPSGVTPDGMRIIASGPPAVPDRVSARLIEASILNNAPAKGKPGGLNNAARPVNPGYYHSNIPSAAPPGTTYLPPATTNPLLAPTNGAVIT